MQSEFCRDYITSRQWRKVANEAKERAGYKCQLCGEYSKRLDAHHNTYEHLGHEKPTDIIILCRECHSLHHTAKRYPKLFRWILAALKHLPLPR